MFRILRSWHTAFKARMIRYFRTREVVKVFSVMHAEELRLTPIENWPLVKARQNQEIRMLRAGQNLIVDRKSWAFPYLPSSVQRLSMPVAKSSPFNLRRFSRTPVARRAINLIKNSVTAQAWDVRPIDGIPVDDPDEQAQRIKIAKAIFNHPNNTESHQSELEMEIEDLCIMGASATELRLTLDPKRPLKMWPMDTSTVRLFVSWSESTPDLPHYAQMTGLQGERGAILFYDDEIMYIKDNQATDNPFGLGKLETAFQVVNDLLGVQRMAGMAGADQVHKCFPGTTEVLTRRGWVRWDEVGDDEEFATRSADGKLQWQRAIAMVREQHDGDMIRFNNRNLTITVTPNHRMYGRCFYKDPKTRKRVGESVGFIEARELFRKVHARPGRKGRWEQQTERTLYDFKIPTTSRWEEGIPLPTPLCEVGGHSFDWNDWVAFLGIWCAEGSCLRRGPNKLPEYRVQIAQSKKTNPRKYKKIAALLTRMGFNYQAKSDRFVFCDHAVWMYLCGLAEDSFSKTVPQWIKDAPAPLIQVFFDWAMMGDGTVRGRKRIYYTVSKRLADDMQELIQKLGSSAAVIPYLDGNSQMYRVEEMVRTELSIIPDGGGNDNPRGEARMPERFEYHGMVYCATVPNGTLYCRENGYPFFTGNTWLWWEQPQTDEAFQIVRRHIQNELEGQAKVSLIGGMKKPETIEVTPVTIDDLLLPWHEMLIRMVANAFDMSAMALGIEHDVNRAVGDVLKDSDFRSAVVPMAKRIQEARTRKILHNKLGWYDLEYVFLSLDDPDLETKTDMNARMYSANALTPNEWRLSVGKQPLKSSFADLTQFEAMMLNQELMAQLTDQSAQKTFDRQQSAQQSAPAGGAGGEGPKPPSQGSISRGGQIESPKPMALPKFPIAGTKWNAREIAQMPVNDLAQRIDGGELPHPKKLLIDMQNQDPNILEQMSDQVKDYFKHVLDDEASEDQDEEIPQKTLDQMMKELRKRTSKQNNRSDDMTQYLQDVNQRWKMATPGKPGAKTYRAVKNPGKPGTPPAARSL
jgi:hypothetical protein